MAIPAKSTAIHLGLPMLSLWAGGHWNACRPLSVTILTLEWLACNSMAAQPKSMAVDLTLPIIFEWELARAPPTQSCGNTLLTMGVYGSPA